MSMTMSGRWWVGLAAAALLGLGAAAQAQPAGALPSRGELLYDTHCRSCHEAQVHWRKARRVRDWPALQAEVRRWQGVAQLGWSEADIAEVARFLDERIYHLRRAGAAGQ